MTTNPPPDDPRLLDSFMEHEPALLRFLHRCVGNPSEARDLVQDVYLRLLQLGNLDAIVDRKAYYWNIGLKVFAEWCRNTATKRKYVITDSTLLEQEGTQPVTDEDEDVLRHHQLKRALEGLSEKECKVLILIRGEGFSCEEVADLLGLSVNTVRKYLDRARAKVKSRMRNH